jgi:hypothetical protein
MNLKRLELAEAADDAAWDAFVEQSPQGTLFSGTPFLRSLQAPFRRFVAHVGGAPLAQVAVVEDGAGRGVRFPFTPYQGILFGPSAGEPRQQVLDEFRLTEFLVEQLTARYPQLELALSWHFQDLRPFLWHNYGRPQAPQFSVVPRYTAVLPLDDLEPADYLAAVRACRRQELKKAAHLEAGMSSDLDAFLDLYAQTFARQQIHVDVQRLDLVRSIAQTALAQGYGRLSACSTTDRIAAMSLFVYDRRRAYYLFAANDPTQRHTFASTRLMFENIFEARRRGLAELDFVGVNSPARGDFKLSFNPELKLYFELNHGAPGAAAA